MNRRINPLYPKGLNLLQRSYSQYQGGLLIKVLMRKTIQKRLPQFNKNLKIMRKIKLKKLILKTSWLPKWLKEKSYLGLQNSVKEQTIGLLEIRIPLIITYTISLWQIDSREKVPVFNWKTNMIFSFKRWNLF